MERETLKIKASNTTALHSINIKDKKKLLINNKDIHHNWIGDIGVWKKRRRKIMKNKKRFKIKYRSLSWERLRKSVMKEKINHKNFLFKMFRNFILFYIIVDHLKR